MKTTYLWAIGIVVVAAAWLASGWLAKPEPPIAPSLAEANTGLAAQREDAPTRVRARVLRAMPQTDDVSVRAITANKRMVEVKAMVGGRVATAPTEQGRRVRTGELLCQLETADRKAWVAEGQAAVLQARLEYEGTVKLRDRGYQSEMQEMTARARLASAIAMLQQRQIELDRTAIRAPFAGVVEARIAELGAFLQPGQPCATLVSPDPMLVVGQVAEKDIANVRAGAEASAVLGDGRTIKGKVTFVGTATDPQMRTYRVEVTVPNGDHSIRAGLTADLRIPNRTVLAHHISPAILALDDAGGVGVRIIDERKVVRMLPVKVIRTDAQGVWVTGLPEVATVITVGQEMVVAGDSVDVTYEPGVAQAAPASGAAVASDGTGGAATAERGS